jgi:MFS transporter, PAT family, beta-lactamase induction signal transducer AmpG
VLVLERGGSLTQAGLVAALAAPWMLKVLWAPLVDCHWWPALGRRRSWILPLQLAMGAACFAGAALHGNLPLLLGLVLVMNLLAATQDIAVDGLAVDLLGKDDLGHGNAIQVAGYKVGMIASGGLLMAGVGWLGWGGLLVGMGVLTLLTLVATFAYEEPPAPKATELGHAPQTFGAVVAVLRFVLAKPGALWLVGFCAVYRIGESLIDGMWTPFLYKVAGLNAAQIGVWVGTWGLVAGLLGTLAGGVLASRWRLDAVLGLAIVLRSGPLATQALLALQPQLVTATSVIGITLVEHVASGVLTTAMFAFMMSRVDRTIGATHYTLLACVEVIGKSPGAWAAGWLADRIGFAALFSVGTALTLAVIPLLGPVFRKPEGEKAWDEPAGTVQDGVHEASPPLAFLPPPGWQPPATDEEEKA